jgi:hypothetical protein
MTSQTMPRAGARISRLMRQVSVLTAVAAFGVALTPAAAHAGTNRSQTDYAWGPNTTAAATNAKQSAVNALQRYAASLGETCSDVTYSNVNLYYIVPGGNNGYVYSATANGDCAPNR